VTPGTAASGLSPRPSEHAGLAETVVAPALRIGGGPADDDVIQEVDINGLGGLAQLARDLDVGPARRGITARVVVLCGVPSYVE
jgi:hypothetical protein